MFYAKNIFTLLICLLPLTTIKPQAQSLPPINMNPTFNNTPNYHNNNTVSPTITCTATSLSYAVAIALRDYMVPWLDKAKNTFNKNNYELLKSIINAFLWEHRYAITGGTLLGSHITTSLLLISDYNFLMNKERWCNWKQKYTFEELCAMSRQQLTKQLLLTINRRHCNNNNPTDSNHPIIVFVHEINTEIDRINRYIKITEVQKKLYLMKLFPTNESKIKNAEQRLTRAHFIKHIFLSWLAEYNLING